MTGERIIPTPAPSDLSTIKILTDGREITGEYHVVSVIVNKAINKIPYARMVILDGDASKEDFTISNSEDFVPGKQIEILAGYHSDEETIFKGIVTCHAIKARHKKSSILEIECRDAASKMAVARRNAYYTQASDSEIMEEIINDFGLSMEVEATNARHKEMVKFNTLDWDFLLSRARANGLLVITDDGKISVTAPDPGQEPILDLVYGSTMMEFEAQMDARTQYPQIDASAWDYADQEVIKEESDPPSLPDQGNLNADVLARVMALSTFPLHHAGNRTGSELKALADAYLLQSRLSRIVGRLKCQGFASVKPGHLVNLKGVGDRFNGAALITSVRQVIKVGNWETDMQFGLSPELFAPGDIVEPLAAGLVPGVNGLQIGLVTQLEEDPDGEDRVLVRMPLVDPGAEGIWCRVASLDAGENRGAFFRPEIDDEVILGFINDDPRDPVILGMLNSSAKPAPITASDDNHEKGFVTREELKLIFDDDKKSVTCETPNGNKVVLSDDEGSIVIQDENGNKIEMSSDGILMESASDINIKAVGDVNIQGVNVKLTADAEFKAKGSAGAEVSTGAVAILKGSLVKIN
jgi:Rhs element Vgr protein